VTATRRLALVLVEAADGVVGRPPPGVDPDAWSQALVEDTYEVAAGLAEAQAGLAGPTSRLPDLGLLTWPGAVLVDCTPAPVSGALPAGVLPTDPRVAGPPVADPPVAASLVADPGVADPLLTDPPVAASLVVASALTRSADVLVLLAPDVPDIPALHLGKLFQALEHAQLAWSPVADGGVAALGFALPLAAWVRAVAPVLDGDPATWRAAAPRPGAAVATPGWHRLRSPADLRHLDPGLSGWEQTRALLAGRPLGP